MTILRSFVDKNANIAGAAIHTKAAKKKKKTSSFISTIGDKHQYNFFSIIYLEFMLLYGMG